MTNELDLTFCTPIGRMVSGNLHVPSTTGYGGKSLGVSKKTGEQLQTLKVGLAIDKKNPDLGEFYDHIREIAQSFFPRSYESDIFSYKMIDGDDPKYAANEGYAGCLVYFFTSYSSVNVYRDDCAHLIESPNEMPPGYYCQILGDADGNDNKDKPGLFMNLGSVRVCGTGPVIVLGPGTGKFKENEAFRPGEMGKIEDPSADVREKFGKSESTEMKPDTELTQPVKPKSTRPF